MKGDEKLFYNYYNVEERRISSTEKSILNTEHLW